jgi:PAS domain S-box-containing protein
VEQLNNPSKEGVPDLEMFEAILDISSEAVWVTDFNSNTNFWYASVGNRDKYGIPKSTVDFSFWTDHVHPEDFKRATEGYQAALHNPTTNFYQHEYRFNGGKGTIYIINDSMRFFRDREGKAIRVVGVWKDVTDIHLREEKLLDLLNAIEADLNRFTIISGISNATMWEVDVHTNRVNWKAGNRTLEEFGLTKANYSLEDWKNSIHEEDRERVVRKFDETITSGATKYEDEYRFIKANGFIAYVKDKGFVIHDSNGKAIKVLGAWLDVTKEKEHEQKLMQVIQSEKRLNEALSSREGQLASSEEELRQINEQLSLNIEALKEKEFIISRSQQMARIANWELDPFTGEIFWSSELYNIVGINPDVKISRPENVLPFLDTNSGKIYTQAFLMLQEHEKPFDITIQVNTPIGYRKWVRITAYPIITHTRRWIVGLAYDVTYFKEAEELMRASEEKFERAFRNNPDLMNIVREEDSRVLDVNDKVSQVLGYSRPEVLGAKSTDFNFFVNEAERAHFYQVYEQVGRVEMEASWRKKDGSVIQVLVSSSQMELEGKKCIISVVRDITDRKNAEEKFQKAFDLSPDLMLIFKESDQILIEANHNLAEFTGYTREEVIGKLAQDFLLWENEEERTEFRKEYFARGRCTVEARLYKKGRIPFYSTFSAQRIKLNNENHILVVIRNITEKKNAEERLIESEANLNATINNTTLMVWSVDRDFNLIKYNEPFRKYVRENYHVDPSQERVELKEENHPLNSLTSVWLERYTRALAGEAVKISDKAFNRYFDFSLNPIIDQGKIMGVSVFAEDVTERVEKEKELKEALNKIGELKLMALRSVMNPHFIFNALNSIQFFIAQNDRENAINYLSTFSKLVRGILTHSVENKIKLSEELEMLRHYIALERMRFDNKFDFDIRIEEGLDLESIEIPSLLIQPYVENAIIHGLYNKEEKGLLRINVREEYHSILFEIEDNGIGRKAAMNLRQLNFPKHKSMGTALTEERLKLINAQDKVSLEIIDLYENGQPSGTKVRIGVKD